MPESNVTYFANFVPYSYTINVCDTNTIIITGYSGPGGAVTIPNQINGKPVAIIGNSVSSAFYDCTNLTSVVIPSSVTSIGYEPFDECFSLTSITVNASNSFYNSTNGVLFNKSQTTLIECPGGESGSYTIPATIASIGDFAFCECSLTNFTIGSGVTSIGFDAFGCCTSLTSVVIPSSVTSIGNYAFDCSSLTNIYFKGNVPSLGGLNVFIGDNNATAYYLPGTSGWTNFTACPTALWLPQILGDSSFGIQSNAFSFDINWASGMVAVVECSTNLLTSSWQPVQTNNMQADTVYFSDPNWTNNPTCFYRIAWQ